MSASQLAPSALTLLPEKIMQQWQSTTLPNIELNGVEYCPKVMESRVHECDDTLQIQTIIGTDIRKGLQALTHVSQEYQIDSKLCAHTQLPTVVHFLNKQSDINEQMGDYEIEQALTQNIIKLTAAMNSVIVNRLLAQS